MNYRIFHPEDIIEARATMPLSKSMAARLIIINALTPGKPTLPDLPQCDDTRVLAEAVNATSGTIDIDGAGTAMRFLTALYASRPEVMGITLTGNGRMLKRPIGPLVDALRTLGADITYLGEEGFPPISINGRELDGGEINVDATISSQFISALLMAAPTMKRRLTVNFNGEPVSAPYINMTIGMMSAHGINAERYGYSVTVEPGRYHQASQPVEGDWSAAAFWYETAALSSGFISLDGLTHPSLQGDSRVADIFATLGVDTVYEGEEGGIDLVPSPESSPRLVMDMGPWPDLVPPVVVTCVTLGIPFHITGIGSLRIKECDRLQALADELGKIGAEIEVTADALVWERKMHPVGELPRFDPHGDHRMAMALAPMAIFVPGIVVCDAEVVDKSYPGYWEQLQAAGFTLDNGDEPYNPEGE